MSESMHILFVGEYGIRNGGENSWLAVAPKLLQQGFRFSAAIPTNTELAESMNSLGVSVVNFSVFDSAGARKTQTAIRADLSQMFTSVAPDVVHCNSLSTGRLCGPVTHELGIPSLGYLRDIIKLSKKAIGDMDFLDRIVAVSEATREFHVGQGMTASKIFVVYNGVDFEEFCPRPASNRLHALIGAKPTDRIVTFIGQIGMRKGLETLLECFFEIARSLDDVHLVIVGQRHSEKDEAIEYESRLRRCSEDAIVRDRIHWLGRRSDISSILNDTDVLLHAARQEPLGRVLLESSATGTPFIATDVGGTREIAGELSEFGIVVPPDNANAMAKRALVVLNNATLHEKLGEGLSARARNVFSADKCAIKLAEHYRDIASKA